MKKVYVIGDCHTSRVQEHYDKKSCDLDIFFWGKAAKKIYDLNFEKMRIEKEESSGKESQQFQGDGVTLFSDIEDDGIIYAWFGYVDIRTFLTKHNNSDALVKIYIDQLITNFPKSEIVIIEPLPQFTEMLLKYEGISPYYTHEERIVQNNLFLKHLHDYCKIKNINSFITQSQILDAIGVRELTPSMTHTKAPHPVDGLKDEYNKKIFNLIYNDIKNRIEKK